MGFDIFCAVCGGPACAFITICDKSRRAALREKREEDPDFSEKDLDRKEFRGYDPEIVSPEDVEWTYQAQVLGFNPKATGLDKMYITQPANYEDYGCMSDVESDDPNFPEDSDEFQCYRVYDATQTPCYPIHEPCFKLLTQVLCGTDNADHLDKDSLYHIISSLTDWGLPALDYGEPSQRYDQCWWSNPGEEMMVAYPLSNPPFTLLLRNTVSTDDFALPSPLTTAAAATSASLSSRVRNDPFTLLPYDITHQIALLLPAESLLALARASYPVHAAIRDGRANPGFWRQALRRCMPWFTELHTLMRHGTVDEESTDYKGLFLWLDMSTRPRRGLAGPFMGVANRRRVWGVCEQYDALYQPRVKAKEKERERVYGVEAEEIWKGVVNVGLPVVTWPPPGERDVVRTASTQWVCRWDEVDAGAFLEVFWDKVGTLAGLALVLGGKKKVIGGDVFVEGGEKRLFGAEGAVVNGARKVFKKDTVEIERGAWIEGLVLHLPDVFYTEKTETSIKGITIRMSNGKESSLGDSNRKHCQRLLQIAPDHALVGITGQISGDHRITRLGLFQHAHFDVLSIDTYNELDSPLLHTPLWTTSPAPLDCDIHNPSHPIWSPENITGAVDLRALPSTDRIRHRYQIQDPYHEDIVPTHPFIWAATERERRNLVSITAWLYEGKHICCVRAEYRQGSGIAPRTAGPPAVVRMMEDEEGSVERMPGVDQAEANGVLMRGKSKREDMGWWKEWVAQMQEVRLHVDGMGGEEVVGVDVVHHEDIQAVRIRTNSSQAYWGETRPIMHYWNFENREADAGDKIAGMALAFTFGRPQAEEIAHRFNDVSGMVLRENPKLSWLATLVVKE
ncbi:F-box domain-containing protein [Lasiodiplodia theobromae]|uniref:F-box domain-containing protein n=1 Tax=Lasiodiplodia theobromae TaxID=45133 RepID=UPI0015C36F13|nr:F-box domain-containing protein [Lasiodiplodia theobromae]KAF4543411.1 F-box domain-containing protein [Lasiodiplodia theobromae]